MFDLVSDDVYGNWLTAASEKVIVRAHEIVHQEVDYFTSLTEIHMFTLVDPTCVVCAHGDTNGMLLPFVNIWQDDESDTFRGQIELIFGTGFIHRGFLGHGVDTASGWTIGRWQSVEQVLFAKGSPSYSVNSGSSIRENNHWELCDPTKLSIFLQDLARFEMFLRMSPDHLVGGNGKSERSSDKEKIKMLCQRLLGLLKSLNAGVDSSWMKLVRQ
ncbi:MAG: hypothetical protein WCW17_00225 [Patescibacteria group bacterium]|jgi:hypothetical protein